VGLVQEAAAQLSTVGYGRRPATFEVRHEVVGSLWAVALEASGSQFPLNVSKYLC